MPPTPPRDRPRSGSRPGPRSGSRPGPRSGSRPAPRRQPALAPRRPIEFRGSRTLADVWAGWSIRRKLRLVRTLALALALVLIMWQCTGDDEPDTPAKGTPRTTAAPTTAPAVAATTVSASEVTTRLPGEVSLAGAAGVGDALVVAGGLDADRSSVATIWRIDPAGGSADDLGELPSPRHAAAVAALGDRALVMGGGKGSSVLDEVVAVDADGQVTTVGELPAPRTAATAISAPDGSVIVVGGSGTDDPALEVLRTTDGVEFTTVATLLHPVRFPAVAMLGQSLWVMGGEWDNAISQGVQRVDLDSGQVFDVALLPTPLSRAAGFALGGSVFVAGGRTTDGRSDQIFRVDAITGAVTSAGALPAARSDAPVAVVDDTAYLTGGLTTAAVDGIVALTAR